MKYYEELAIRARENQRLAQEANKANGLSRQVLRSRTKDAVRYTTDKAGTRRVA
jgi:hypothetical protein